MTLPQMFTEPCFWFAFAAAFLLLLSAAGFGRGFWRGYKRSRERQKLGKEAAKKLEEEEAVRDAVRALEKFSGAFEVIEPEAIRKLREKAAAEAAAADEANFLLNVATGFAIHRGSIAPEAFNRAEEVLTEAKRRGYFKPPRGPLAVHFDPPRGQSEQA